MQCAQCKLALTYQCNLIWALESVNRTGFQLLCSSDVSSPRGVATRAVLSICSTYCRAVHTSCLSLWEYIFHILFTPSWETAIQRSARAFDIQSVYVCATRDEGNGCTCNWALHIIDSSVLQDLNECSATHSVFSIILPPCRDDVSIK